MADAGLIVLVSFISPYRAERQMARELMPEGQFIEVFVDTPIKECRRRDPKGLYAKADAGQIFHFTGISSAYDVPIKPDLHLRNLNSSSDTLVEFVSLTVLGNCVQLSSTDTNLFYKGDQTAPLGGAM